MNRQTDKLEASNHLHSEDFLSEIGLRVRSTRENKALTRKDLSKASGVSERHLAQLETGKGNISVRLLHQIANALETPIENLVELNSKDSTTIELLSKVYQLDANQKRQVIERIERWVGQQADGKKNGRIALVGLRGAGKSTIGRKTSEILDIPFVELDDEITANAGISVADIFSDYGASRYRELERTCLEKVLAEQDNLILAVAGGIVSNNETYNLLLNSFHTVWVSAEPEEHMGRVMAQGDRRPVQGNPDAMNNLRFLLETRIPHYELAQHRLNTSEKSIADCCQELSDLIQTFHPS